MVTNHGFRLNWKELGQGPSSMICEHVHMRSCALLPVSLSICCRDGNTSKTSMFACPLFSDCYVAGGGYSRGKRDPAVGLEVLQLLRAFPTFQGHRFHDRSSSDLEPAQ